MFTFRKSTMYNKWFVLLMVFTFLKPAGIANSGYNSLNAIINLVQLVFILLVAFVTFRNSPKISKTLLSEIMFFAVWILCFLVNDSDVSQLLKLALFGIGIELIFEHYLKQNKFSVLVDAFTTMYIILLSINLFLMIRNYGWKLGINNGMYETFSFLESDNGTTGYVIGALLFGMLSARIKGKKFDIKLILIIILSLLNELRLWSASALVGIAIILIYIIFFRDNKLLKINYVLIGAILANVGITFFGFQKAFAFVIENVLGRTVEMTGRTKLWNMGLEYWKDSIVFGTGDKFVYQLDNVLIKIIVQGGLILLIAFLVYFVTALSRALINRDKENAILRDCYFVLCVIIILSSAEAWQYFKGFYIIVSLLANAYRYSSIGENVQCAK